MEHKYLNHHIDSFQFNSFPFQFLNLYHYYVIYVIGLLILCNYNINVPQFSCLPQVFDPYCSYDLLFSFGPYLL